MAATDTKRRLFQYAKSTDPATIAAVQKMRDDITAFHADAMAFARQHSLNDDPGVVYSASYTRGAHIAGVASREKPTTGQWKKLNHGTWAPYERNPITKEMRALRRIFDPIPGIAKDMYMGSDNRGTYFLMPDLRVIDGVAYCWFAVIPDSGSDMGEEWQEIRASEWYAAHERAEEA